MLVSVGSSRVVTHGVFFSGGRGQEGGQAARMNRSKVSEKSAFFVPETKNLVPAHDQETDPQVPNEQLSIKKQV